MILTDFNIGDQPWLNKIVDALVDTWNMVPVGKRWTLGAIVAVIWILKNLEGFLRGCKAFFEGIASIIAAMRGKEK